MAIRIKLRYLISGVTLAISKLVAGLRTLLQQRRGIMNCERLLQVPFQGLLHSARNPLSMDIIEYLIEFHGIGWLFCGMMPEFTVSF